MNNGDISNLDGSVVEFQNLCQKRLNSVLPANRYQCVNALTVAIQKKKGAYTGDERQDWLRILFTCLAAPDCYFTQYPLKRKDHQKVEKFEKKHLLLQQKLEAEMMKASGMYAYLDSIRDYMRNPVDQIKECYPLAQKFYKKVFKALQGRIKQYPELANFEPKYEETLNKIFYKEQERLNHQIFFLFLPYYVFFELAKCENLIRSDENAFSVPQLNQNNLSWNIRNVPFRYYSETNIRRLLELYMLVEQALCCVLSKQKYRGLGQAASITRDRYTADLPTQCSMLRRFLDSLKITEEAPEEEALKEEALKEEIDSYDDYFLECEAIFFSAPIWKYDEWTIWFERVFHLENSSLKRDLQQIFSLSLRIASKQSEKSLNLIYDRYKSCQMRSRKRVFQLSELMAALSKIYNASYFADPDPFLNHDLQCAIELLSSFMVAIGMWYSDVEGRSSIDKKWLNLLRLGYANNDSYIPFMDIYCNFIINPSRTLVQSMLLHWLAKKCDGSIHENNFVQEYFGVAVFKGDDDQYETLMQMFQDELYVSLNSPDNLMGDIAFWGGIKIREANIAHIMNELQIWSFWRERESTIYMQIAAAIKKKPDCLKNFLEQLTLTSTKAEKTEFYGINTFGTPDTDKTTTLEKYKMQIILALPEKIFDLLGELEKTGDLSYYKNLSLVIREQYGGLEELLNKLKEIRKICPKIKLKKCSLSEILENFLSNKGGESEPLDISFLPKSKKCLLEDQKKEETIEDYNKNITQLKEALIWLDNFFKIVVKSVPETSKAWLYDKELFEIAHSRENNEVKILKVRSLSEWIVGLLMELNPLDDFQYFLLLCILFSALKKELCHDVYEQAMKFLPFVRTEFPPQWYLDNSYRYFFPRG